MGGQLYLPTYFVFMLYTSVLVSLLGLLIKKSLATLDNREDSPVSLLVLTGAVTYLSWKISTNYYKHGLQRYPGPLLAKFTKLWHLLSVYRNEHHLSMIDIHRKYGPVVRIGPSALSISDPAYILQIYGASTSFLKSSMYEPFSPRIGGKPLPSLVSERDEHVHMALRKPVAGFYSLTTLLDYEPLVDSEIQKLVRKLRPFAYDGSVCDMTSWLCWFAFDMITNLTFGESIGFMDRGEDVKNFIRVLDNHVDDAAVLSTVPWAALLWKQNPIVSYFKKEYTVLTPFIRRKIRDHVAYQSAKAHGAVENDRSTDFTDRFLKAARCGEWPGFNINLVVNWTLGNFTAGGDTTAIALRSVIYYILRSPSVYEQLMNELTKAKLAVPVSWKQAQELPYLDACIREALRMHPSIGLGLEREVPATGLTLPDGFRVGKGVQVSMNPWVIAHNGTTFGSDVDEYRPIRWLPKEDESADVFLKRMKEMKRADLVFGAGSRSCIGRNISFLEIYKAVPSLLLSYRFSLVDPSRWSVRNRWMVRQTGLDCYLRTSEHLA